MNFFIFTLNYSFSGVDFIKRREKAAVVPTSSKNDPKIQAALGEPSIVPELGGALRDITRGTAQSALD